jgi:hypothetical protein
VNLKLKQISVSVIVEKPLRRELLSVYVDDFGTSIHVEHNAKSLELSIGGLQVDSYSETSTSPVLIHLVPDAAKGVDPVIHLIIVEEIPKGSVTPHFKYIAAKILEIKVVIDSASLQLLGTHSLTHHLTTYSLTHLTTYLLTHPVLDLGCDFNLMSKTDALAYQDPISFIHEYNGSILAAETHLLLADVFKSQGTAMAPRVYIENLILHPIKLTITFTQVLTHALA